VGNVVHHPSYGRCTVQQIDKDGRVLIVAEKFLLKHTVEASTLKLLAKSEPFCMPGPDYDLGGMFRERTRGMTYAEMEEELSVGFDYDDDREMEAGWTRMPRWLLGALPPDEYALLTHLCDWYTFRLSRLRAILQKRGGLFYCSQKHIERELPWATRRVQARLFKALAEKGLIVKVMKHGRNRNGKQHVNHRMIAIDMRYIRACAPSRRPVESTEDDLQVVESQRWPVQRTEDDLIEELETEEDGTSEQGNVPSNADPFHPDPQDCIDPFENDSGE
jgi:hypothetical protein